ncbi:MAG: energy-coupling factor transporter ATPase [Clostridiales bacterium]|nr:energy-coupling factor transporter ATPase [Clostridiales bacterium]
MKENIVIAQQVDFIYKSHTEGVEGVKALSDVTLSFEKGQFIVVLGRNGSGKSTLARLLNALQLPTKGTVYVGGMNTLDDEQLWEIRRTAGMIFQNPDNQIVGTTVEEDVAFAPENLGVPPLEIRDRVNNALKTVGIYESRKHAPHLLSGGQKQRVAIAGILAMRPECIILDESTAMLDPVGRKEVMQVMKKLNKEEGVTVIHITHHMDEASTADRVVVIDKGMVVLDGKPRKVFSNVEAVKSLGLDVPQITELFYELNKSGIDIPYDILTVEEAYNEILNYKRKAE